MSKAGYPAVVTMAFTAIVSTQATIGQPGTGEAPAPKKHQLGRIEGTVFDASYSEYTQFASRDDVVIGNEGRVILREMNRQMAAETSLDSTSHYGLNAPATTYEIEFVNAHQFMVYRRAHVRLSPGESRRINLYVIPHPGLAETVHGDVALPEPVTLYDDYHPYPSDPDLDLLVQYGIRAESGSVVSYGGPFLIVTFDRFTIRARKCVIDTRTLMTVATEDVFADLGQTRLRVDRAQLEPKGHVMKLFIGDEVREYRF